MLSKPHQLSGLGLQWSDLLGDSRRPPGLYPEKRFLPESTKTLTKRSPSTMVLELKKKIQLS